MDEDIDLRPYVELLIERWSWILIGVIIAAVTAFVISSILPKTYVAESGVAIARSRTDVSFDSQIRTLSEDELGTFNQTIGSRRDALVALVKTSDVANLVLEEIGASLNPEEQAVTRLLKMVEASSAGDLIFITISHENPETAALIANSWGKNYEKYINELYGNEPRINLELLAEQVSNSKSTYEEAQARLESFIESNKIGLLNQEIKSRQAVLSTTLTARNNIQAGSADLQVETDIQIQADLYSDLQQIERLLADATSLRGQVVANSNSAATDIGNVLSYIGLSNNVFGGVVSTELQLDIGSEIPSDFEVQVSDVDTLIEVLETRRESTLAQIESNQESLLTRDLEETRLETDHILNTSINSLDTEIQSIRAEIEAYDAENRELVQARDLAWNTYQSLLRKQAEALIVSQTTGTEVIFASSAIQPDQPSGLGRLFKTIIAAVLAAGAVSVVLILDKWWQRGQNGISVSVNSESESDEGNDSKFG